MPAEQRERPFDLGRCRIEIAVEQRARRLEPALEHEVPLLPCRAPAQGGSFDARGNLLRAEAEYYLTVANTELTLTRD